MFEFLRRSSPLWRNANFNRLWTAQILSAFGSRITRTAIPIIAVGALAVTPWEAALLSALSYAPYMLAGALGGGFVERANKTRLMVALDLLRFVIVIAAPLAWYFNLLNFWLLCGLAAATGAASALFQNADVAVLPRLVAKDQLVDANARLPRRWHRRSLRRARCPWHEWLQPRRRRCHAMPCSRHRRLPGLIRRR